NATIYFMVNKMDAKEFRGILALWHDILQWNRNRKESDPNHKDIWAFYCSAKIDEASVDNGLTSWRNKGINKIFKWMAKECYAKRLHAEEAGEITDADDSDKLNTAISENTSASNVWKNLKTFWGNLKAIHKTWIRGNVLLAVALIALLIVASLPLG